MLSDGTIGLRICPNPMADAVGGLALATERLRRTLADAGVSDEQSERMEPRRWERLVERVAAKEFQEFKEATIRLRNLAMVHAS